MQENWNPFHGKIYVCNKDLNCDQLLLLVCSKPENIFKIKQFCSWNGHHISHIFFILGAIYWCSCVLPSIFSISRSNAIKKTGKTENLVTFTMYLLGYQFTNTGSLLLRICTPTRIIIHRPFCRASGLYACVACCQ